jgi:hypothetical protein
MYVIIYDYGYEGYGYDEFDNYTQLEAHILQCSDDGLSIIKECYAVEANLRVQEILRSAQHKQVQAREAVLAKLNLEERIILGL